MSALFVLSQFRLALWTLWMLSLSNLIGCQAYRPSSMVFPLQSVQSRKYLGSNTRLFFKDDERDLSSRTKEQLKNDWLDRSKLYYNKVMREQRRKELGQANKSLESQQSFDRLAIKHYVAWTKIHNGKPEQAELIYRRIINDDLLDQCMLPNLHSEETSLVQEAHCDHAKLAITTLLLALVLQRIGANAKKTRSVFLTFYRVAITNSTEKECACSAKVLGAWSLFEMKQGNTKKSLQLAQLSYQMDPAVMKPLLHWKQFRDAAASMTNPTTINTMVQRLPPQIPSKLSKRRKES